MGTPTAKFPSAIADASWLTIATNQLQTRLAVPCGAADTTLGVVDAGRIVQWSLLTLNDGTNGSSSGVSEIVLVTAPPAGNILTVQRGYDGTAAKAHAAGAIVSGYVVAWHQKSLAAEVAAIEQTLGPQLANVGTGVPGVFVSLKYAFTPQTPGGSLAIGNNSINIAPVPQGVNGTDTDHWLYIDQGTGAAEPVKITGGSAVSGASSGSLIVNCANTHSGAWRISSATAGIQEALVSAAPVRGVVMVPPTSNGHTVPGPISMPAYTTMMGPAYGAHRGQFDVAPGPGFGQQAGVTLSFTYGAGSTAGQQILMRTGCTVAGLNFNYPNQVNTPTPVAYPPTIALDGSTGDADHCKVYDCFGVNPYIFVQAITQHSRLHLRGLYGTPIRMGISIHNATDADLIEDVLFKGLYHDSSTSGAYDPTRLPAYCIANGVGIQLDLADGIRINNVYMFGYNRGLLVTKSGSRGAYGMISNYATDSTRFGLYVSADGISNMLLCTNCNFSGHDGVTLGASYGVLCTLSPTGLLVLNGCAIGSSIAAGQNAIFTDSTRIIMTGGWIINWGGPGKSAIQLHETGTITLAGVYIGGVGNGVGIVAYFNSTGKPATLLGVECGVPLQFFSLGGALPVTETIGCHDSNGAFPTKLPVRFTSSTLAVFETENYIAGETGASNAIAGALVDAGGVAVPYAAGLRISILLAHGLQAGANTMNLNGLGAKAIKSGRNPANNIAAPYVAGAIFTGIYDGTQFLDVSQ